MCKLMHFVLCPLLFQCLKPNVWLSMPVGPWNGCRTKYIVEAIRPSITAMIACKIKHDVCHIPSILVNQTNGIGDYTSIQCVRYCLFKCIQIYYIWHLTHVIWIANNERTKCSNDSAVVLRIIDAVIWRALVCPREWELSDSGLLFRNFSSLTAVFALPAAPNNRERLVK